MFCDSKFSFMGGGKPLTNTRFFPSLFFFLQESSTGSTFNNTDTFFCCKKVSHIFSADTDRQTVSLSVSPVIWNILLMRCYVSCMELKFNHQNMRNKNNSCSCSNETVGLAQTHRACRAWGPWLFFKCHRKVYSIVVWQHLWATDRFGLITKKFGTARWTDGGWILMMWWFPYCLSLALLALLHNKTNGLRQSMCML